MKRAQKVDIVAAAKRLSEAAKAVLVIGPVTERGVLLPPQTRESLQEARNAFEAAQAEAESA